MPGVFYELKCLGCRAKHVIYDGAAIHRGRLWAFRQFACPQCRRIRSRQAPAGEGEALAECPECRSRMRPWKGFAGHEEGPDGEREFKIRGPCPACERTLDLDEIRQSVGLLMEGMWD